MEQYNHKMLRDAWCVYTIRSPGFENVETPRVLFVGCCKLSQIVTMPDAWTYVAFNQIFAGGMRPTMMQVIGVRYLQEEAETLQSTIVQVERAPVNLDSLRCDAPTAKGRPGRAIACDQTGIQYASITHAAEAMNLNKASLSHYFAGRQKSVGGYTFRKVEE